MPLIKMKYRGSAGMMTQYLGKQLNTTPCPVHVLYPRECVHVNTVDNSMTLCSNHLLISKQANIGSTFSYTPRQAKFLRPDYT